MSSTSENSDPYLYPGTNVLKNLRGLTDPEQRERFEARRSHQRIAELIDNPLSGAFDVAHLKAIHRYIFQEVYEWTGQFRTVNISKGGHLFGLANFLEPSLEQVLKKLVAEPSRPDQALKYMRYRHSDFNISKAELLGMIALLAGSPLD